MRAVAIQELIGDDGWPVPEDERLGAYVPDSTPEPPPPERQWWPEPVAAPPEVVVMFTPPPVFTAPPSTGGLPIAREVATSVNGVGVVYAENVEGLAPYPPRWATEILDDVATTGDDDVSWLSSGVRKLGKVAKKALPAVALGALGLPGAGAVVSRAIGAIGGMVGGITGAANDAAATGAGAAGALGDAAVDAERNATTRRAAGVNGGRIVRELGQLPSWVKGGALLGAGFLLAKRLKWIR